MRGRGPTRPRTTIGNDLIVCLLADTLTKSARKLVEAGEERLVLGQRSASRRAGELGMIGKEQRIGVCEEQRIGVWLDTPGR